MTFSGQEAANHGLKSPAVNERLELRAIGAWAFVFEGILRLSSSKLGSL